VVSSRHSAVRKYYHNGASSYMTGKQVHVSL